MLKVANAKRFLTGTTFVDLFAGLGGFRLALESFGGKCVFSSDFDKNVAEVYEKNFGEKPAGDITKIDATDIPKHDILCAGFPCQPFSISGKQAGFEDTRGTLFFDVARIAKHHKPKLIFLENVRNFEVHDNGKTLATVKTTLQDLGYTVQYRVLNASYYGVPHARKRLYILAFRNDINSGKFQFPKIPAGNITVADILEKSNEELRLNVDYELLPNYEIIAATKQKAPIKIGQIGLGRQGERIYHIAGHSITLASSGGGLGGKTGIYLIDDHIRTLSSRESARLCGFPEWYQPHERLSMSRKQFGNTVVINVLQHILTGLLPLF